MKQLSRKTQDGFTLMEVMVAVSIFAIVVTVGIGSLLTINNTYRKSQTDRQAIDSLTFTLESMSRALRTAAEWDAAISYGGGATTSFAFKDQDGVDIMYSYDGVEEKILMDYQCNGCQNPTLIDNIYDMTPANVTITDLSFLPLKSPGGQSYVQINVAGKVVNGKQESRFAFQTGVSKRVLDQ